MKRKRRKEWKKRIGKKTLKSIMIQDHEVRCSVVYIPFGRCGGLMVSVLDCGSIGLSSNLAGSLCCVLE